MLITFLKNFFLAGLLTSSFMMLLIANPIHSLLFLVLVFVNAAGLLMSLDMEFIALLLIIIYVGAIAVLFIIVLMMIDISSHSTFKNEWLVFFLCSFLLVVSLFIVLMYLGGVDLFIPGNLFQISVFSFGNQITSNFADSTIFLNTCSTLGQRLYSFDLFFFLIAGLILLLALMGAVILTSSVVPNNEKASSDNFQLLKKAISRRIY